MNHIQFSYTVEESLAKIGEALRSIAITYATMVQTNLNTIEEARKLRAVQEERDQKAFAALVELAQGRAAQDDDLIPPPGTKIN